MDRWEFKPLVSVGIIKFGMSREEVRDLLGGEYTEFKKSKYSKNTTDDYGSFHVFYTIENKVEAVEIFDGIEIVWNDEIIFPIAMNEIEDKISGIEKNGNEYTHIGMSVGISAGDAKAESILVGEKGYYE
jgi:hypothetical protein